MEIQILEAIKYQLNYITPSDYIIEMNIPLDESIQSLLLFVLLGKNIKYLKISKYISTLIWSQQWLLSISLLIFKIILQRKLRLYLLNSIAKYLKLKKSKSKNLSQKILCQKNKVPSSAKKRFPRQKILIKNYSKKLKNNNEICVADSFQY